MHIAVLEACCRRTVSRNGMFLPCERAQSNLKDLLQARHAGCKGNICPERFRIYSSSPFRDDQRVNVHMDKKYVPAHWGLITPRQRLSLSTMSRDKDSGQVFPFLPGYTEFLSPKCDMVEKQKDDSCRLLHSEGRAVVIACWDSCYSTVVRLQLLFYSINNGNA